MKQTKKRRTEITIETHSLTIIKIRNVKSGQVFCSRCSRDVQVLTPLHAALIFRVSNEFIADLLLTGHIHNAVENALCSVSLADHFKQEIRFLED
jgi:hypothetical protein